jgi:AcrR family transcriptional regulator
MASVTRKPQAGRRAQRQGEIEADLLEATETLMADGTAFTELSVDRLATAAGISRATFYIYFEDKSDLLRRLARQVFDELGRGGHQWWDVAEQRRVDDVRASMSAIVATYVRHRAVLTALVEMAAYDRDVNDTYRTLMDAVIAAAQTVVARAVDSGAVPALPVHETVTALAWMVERTCQQALGPPDAEVDEGRLVEALTEIIWRTLYLEPAGG